MCNFISALINVQKDGKEPEHLCAFKTTNTKQCENKIQGKKNEIHVCKKGHHELNGPDAIAGRAVIGTRIVSECVNGPNDSSNNIQNHRDHKENEHKPVQIKGQTGLQLFQDVGGDDQKQNGERDNVQNDTKDQSWFVSVTSEGNKNHAAHKSLQNFPESRKSSQVAAFLLVQAFVFHHLENVDEATQEGKHAHYPAVHTCAAGIEVGIRDGDGDGHERRRHGHSCSEVIPVHTKHSEDDIKLEHLNDGDDESHDGAKSPGEHGVVPVGVSAPSSEGTQEKGDHRDDDLSHVQRPSSRQQSRRGEHSLGQCLLHVVKNSHLGKLLLESALCSG